MILGFAFSILLLPSKIRPACGHWRRAVSFNSTAHQVSRLTALPFVINIACCDAALRILHFFQDADNLTVRALLPTCPLHHRRRLPPLREDQERPLAKPLDAPETPSPATARVK